MPTAALKMTIADLEAFLASEFPQAIEMATIAALEPGRVQCRSRTNAADLRPGGTLSGPTMMALVDLTAYLLVLASIGPVALAVTSHLSIHFLRKPQPGDLLATAALLRLSRRQLVCAVEVHSDGEPDPVAHATVTYAIPA
jgi:acyl-coenzyme A thioesterase PaaI-like protein